MADLASLDHHDFPIRLPLQRRRVWRACECCRRKKIKCDGREPICSQCTQTSSTCNWIQTKDRAALSRQCVRIRPLNRRHANLLIPLSYVQELEARLVQMEGLLTQVGSTPPATDLPLNPPSQTHQQHQQSPPPLPSSNSAPAQQQPAAPVLTPDTEVTPAYVVDPNVKQEPADPDQFGQLAMDPNGHLRWIGGSSAMTLVDAFRNISNRSSRHNSADARGSRLDITPTAHNLYFPPIIRSDVRALPGPEQAEFPHFKP